MVEGQDVGVAMIRFVAGTFFVAHGCQMLFGWFGGRGFGGARTSFHRLGFRPAGLMVAIAATGELGGGLGLLLGVLWPIPAVILIGPMTVAIARVHWPRIWVTESGIEYPLVLGVTMAGVAFLSVGDLSTDHLLGIDLPKTATYVTSLALVLPTALFTIAVSWWQRDAKEPV